MKINLFSVPISITPKSQALALVGEWVITWRILNGSKQSPSVHSVFSIRNSVFPKIILTPNPEIIVAAQSDPELLKALQSADLAIPDGIGVVWALKILNTEFRILNGAKKSPPAHSVFSIHHSVFPLSRVSGLDLMEGMIRQPQKVSPFEPKLKIMLLGGRPGVAQAAAASLRRKFRIQNSEFRIKSLSGPQNLAAATPHELNELVNSINQFSPDLLFVGFGHPKQEKWLAASRRRLAAGIAMAVGGALDQLADPTLRPPIYINSIGLGWLYRLLRQPWRWRRQLALLKFVRMVVTEKIKSPNAKIQMPNQVQNPNAKLF